MDISSLQMLGSAGTAVAALVAILTYRKNVKRTRNDVIESYSTDVRRKIRDFELQLQMWNDEFEDSKHVVMALAELEDALLQEGVPSPATPAFDEFIERYGRPLCLTVWTTALQSTDVERHRESFLKAAYSFDGLLLIVHSASRILDLLTRELYSAKLLGDIVEQLGAPERRQLQVDERLEQGRGGMVSHRDEVREFVNLVRIGFASYQKEVLQVRRDVRRFFREFFFEMKNLSDSDLHHLSHLREKVRRGVRDSEYNTKDMTILLDAIKKAVAIDKNNKLADIISGIEAEAERLASSGGIE